MINKKFCSKKIAYLIGFFIVFLLLTSLLSACDNNKVGVVVFVFDANADDAHFNNGQKVITKQVKVNSAFVPIEEEPQRENYIFTGWCLDKDGKNPVKSNFVAIKSITIYASWVHLNEYEHPISIDPDAQEFCTFSFSDFFPDDVPLKAKFDTEISFRTYIEEGYEVQEGSFGYYIDNDKNSFVNVEYNSKSSLQKIKMPANSITITLKTQKKQYKINMLLSDKSLKGDVVDIYLSSKTAGFDEYLTYSIIPNFGYYIENKTIGVSEKYEESSLKGKIKMPKNDVLISINVQKIDYSKTFPISINSNIENFDFESLNMKQQASVGEFVFIDINKLLKNYKINEITINGANNFMEYSGFYMPKSLGENNSVQVYFDLEELDKTEEYSLNIERDITKGEISSEKDKYFPGEKINLNINGLEDYYIESLFLSGRAVSLDNMYMPAENATLSISLQELKDFIKLDYDKAKGNIWIYYNKKPAQPPSLKVFVKPNRGYKIGNISIDNTYVEQSYLYKNNQNYYNFSTQGQYYVYTLTNTCDSIFVEFTENHKFVDFELIDSSEIVNSETVSANDGKIYDLEILTLNLKQADKNRIKEVKISQKTSIDDLVVNTITIAGADILLKNEISYFLNGINEGASKLIVEVIALNDTFYEIHEYIGSAAENPVKIDLIPEYNKAKKGDNIKIYIRHYTFDSAFIVTYGSNENSTTKYVSQKDDFFEISDVSNDVHFSVIKNPQLNSTKEVRINLICKNLNAVKINKNKFYVGEKAIIYIDENFDNYYIDNLSYANNENIPYPCFIIEENFAETMNISVTLKEKEKLDQSINEIHNLALEALNSDILNSVYSYESLEEKNKVLNFGESSCSTEFYSNYISSILYMLTKNNLPIYILELNDRKMANELLSVVKCSIDKKHNMISDAYIQKNHIIISYIGKAKDVYNSLLSENSFIIDSTKNIIYYTLTDKTLGVFSYLGSNNCVIIPKNHNNIYISRNDTIQTLNNTIIIANYIKNND